MGLRIWKEGNKIIYSDSSFDRDLEDSSADVDVYPAASADAFDYVLKGKYIGERDIVIGDVQDESGTAYTLQGWIDFYRSSTGFNPASGGSGAGVTGWGDYVGTLYTSESPLELSADTDTVLPNNKATTIETQKPSDVTTFYDGSVITGRNGDGILITVDFKALPTNSGTTYIELWFDITGGTGTPENLADLYRRIISFPKGNGVERPINFTVSGYTLDTWENNGAQVYVRTNNTCDIYDVRFLITRTHKAV